SIFSKIFRNRVKMWITFCPTEACPEIYIRHGSDTNQKIPLYSILIYAPLSIYNYIKTSFVTKDCDGRHL
ncbi:MAG: hypothetical protein ACUVUH_06070, partial [bacterium]